MQFDISNKSIVNLAKVFSPTILKELSNTGKSNKLSSILNELSLIKHINLEQTVASFFNEAYNLLSKYYKNEYIYRNTIIKNILLGRHSLNTAFVINEFRVGNSKADCVIFNGTSTVYEIKSQFDTFNRLKTQLEDYKKAFEYIYIVVPNESLKKLEVYLDDESIGIMRLNSNNSISKIKEAKSNKYNWDKNIIFDILRKNEYLYILNKYYGEIPEMPNTKVYSYCKELFSKLDLNEIYQDIVWLLKMRGNNELYKKLILNAPDSLKALCFQTNLTKREKINLIELLDRQIEYII